MPGDRWGTEDVTNAGRDRQARQRQGCGRRFTAHSAAAGSSYRVPDDVMALAVRWYLRWRLPVVSLGTSTGRKLAGHHTNDVCGPAQSAAKTKQRSSRSNVVTVDLPTSRAKTKQRSSWPFPTQSLYFGCFVVVTTGPTCAGHTRRCSRTTSAILLLFGSRAAFVVWPIPFQQEVAHWHAVPTDGHEGLAEQHIVGAGRTSHQIVTEG